MLRPQSPKSATHFQILRMAEATATSGMGTERIPHLVVKKVEGVGEVEEVAVGQTKGKKSDVQNGRMSITHCRLCLIWTDPSSRNPGDRRARNAEQTAKRQRLGGGEQDLPVYATKFSKEEIETQEKKPKRKVAVMLGYSGTGYKGMQL